MSNIFIVLLLLSIVGLAIGLAKPQWVKMPSRKIAGGVFGGAAIVFFILFGVTSSSASQSASDTASTTATTVGKADGTTQDIYTTTVGQTVYPLKNRYTGDFFVTLDGFSLAFTDDSKANPQDYQAVYNDDVPSITLTSDPGTGHILKVFENATPTADDGTPLTPEQAQDRNDAGYVSYFNTVILYAFVPVGTALVALGKDMQTLNDADAISQLQSMEAALQKVQSDLQTAEQTYQPLSPNVEHIDTLMNASITAGLKGASISLTDWKSGDLDGAADAITQYITGTMMDNFASAKAAAAGWKVDHPNQ